MEIDGDLEEIWVELLHRLFFGDAKILVHFLKDAKRFASIDTTFFERCEKFCISF